MKENINVTVDKDKLEILRKIKREEGVPISVQINKLLHDAYPNSEVEK